MEGGKVMRLGDECEQWSTRGWNWDCSLRWKNVLLISPIYETSIAKCHDIRCVDERSYGTRPYRLSQNRSPQHQTPPLKYMHPIPTHRPYPSLQNNSHRLSTSRGSSISFFPPNRQIRNSSLYIQHPLAPSHCPDTAKQF